MSGLKSIDRTVNLEFKEVYSEQAKQIQNIFLPAQVDAIRCYL